MGEGLRRHAAGEKDRGELRAAWLREPPWDDQVLRREALEAYRPDAEIRRTALGWEGAVKVGGRLWGAYGRDLRALLDKLGRLVALDEALEAVAGDYPGWRPWLSDGPHWYAVRQGGAWRDGDPRPLTVDADTVGALRAELDEWDSPAPAFT